MRNLRRHRHLAFAFDLTQATLPTGLVATRTGDALYLQRSASTVERSTALEAFEDRGDGTGGGQWVFDAYANNAPSANDFRASAGWTVSNLTITSDAAVGPDGTTTADTLTDASTSQAGRLSFTGVDGSTTSVIASAWIQDASPTPASQGGLSPRPDNGNGVALGTGSAWRRIYAAYGPAGTAVSAFSLYPTGAPVSGGVLAPIASATGAVNVWGVQVARNTFDVPRVDGSTGQLLLDAVDPSKLLEDNGDLHLEGGFLTTDIPLANAPSASDAWYMFSASTPSGEAAISYGQSSVAVGYLNGANKTGGRNIGPLPPYSEVRWEIWSRPSEGKAGMQIWINGYRFTGAEVRFTPVVVPTPTAFHLQHRAGTKLIGRRASFLRRASGELAGRRSAHGTEDVVEGLILGDSIMGPFSGLPAVGIYLYTFEAARSRPGILSFATPAETIDDQKARYDGSVQKGKTYVKWVAIQVGVNNVNPSGNNEDAPTAIAKLQALVADINAANPDAIVYLSPITPCRSAVGETGWARVLAFNDAIAGNGPTPITGTNLRRLPTHSAFDDGNGNLVGGFGDGLHTDAAQRQYQGVSEFRPALIADGFM